MGHDVTELKDIALQVASEAARLVLQARQDIAGGAEFSVDTKSSQTDVVTAVDRQSEDFIRQRLAQLRPGEHVLGEEGGGNPGLGVTWVADPIDGTVNFLYGLPWFAVSLAAQINGVSVAGAVVEPVSGRQWTAARGKGAWLDGRELKVSQPEKLALALIGTGFAYVVERRVRQAQVVSQLLGDVRDIRRMGAASLDLCAVAAGWLDGYFEHNLGPWDWAAGALIAEEAGAIVSLPGHDLALGADAAIVAAPAIMAELRSRLVEYGAAEI